MAPLFFCFAGMGMVVGLWRLCSSGPERALEGPGSLRTAASAIALAQDPSGAAAALSALSAAAGSPPESPRNEPPTLGVPACDEYFKQLYACAERLPAEVRPVLLSGIEDNLAGWRGMAVREENRAMLEADCSRKREIMRTNALCAER